MAPSNPARTFWSTLQQDLLEMILARVDLINHARFSSVCKHWNLVATENPPINKPFMLVRTNKTYELIPKFLASFFPNLLGKRRIKFVGSFEGWLVVQIGVKYVVLLNPGLRTKIELPLVHAQSPRKKVKKVVFSSSPSTSSCVCVLVLLENHGGLYYCRMGDTAWTQVPCLGIMMKDIIFFEDQLYAIDVYSRLRVFDSGLNSQPSLINMPTMIEGASHLVNSHVEDKLLVIESIPRLDRAIHQHFKVFEFDPSRDSNFVELRSLGDKMLFLSNACSISLSAEDQPSFLPNHIYIFTYSSYGDMKSVPLR